MRFSNGDGGIYAYGDAPFIGNPGGTVSIF